MIRVLAVAESDSYLKWAASLLDQLVEQRPEGASGRLVVPVSPIRPSPEQRGHALAGTSFSAAPVIGLGAIRRLVDAESPDAVLLACTGPTALAVQRELTRASHRPVLLAGIPGIALPVRPEAWYYRCGVDLMVAHSRRELVEFTRVGRQCGLTGRVGLATLPFLPAAASAPIRARNTVVFATQGKVPAAREQREAVLLSLAALAANRPDLDVVVKTRGVPGEFHTHYEPHHYQDLWARLARSGRVSDPDAVLFAAGSMAVHLSHATGFVTVSSTAALEAIALGVPLLLLDEFGVGDRLINTVFTGSGCLAGLADLERGRFRHPDPEWLHDNYFHPPVESTWVAALGRLVQQARSGELPPLASRLEPGWSFRSGRVRRDRWRLSRAGSVAVRARRRLTELSRA